MKFMRSIAAVTTRLRECLIAASAAASSTSFMTVPPWTLPAELAWPIPIQRASSAADSEGDLGSTRADTSNGLQNRYYADVQPRYA
jgi:hypothetical protein